jgi:hypothetical protein
MERSTLVRWGLILGIIVAVCAVAAPARAEFGYSGWGLRGGLSVDPDQIFVGGQVEFEFLEHFFFWPNATVGFGDDITLFSINPDLAYTFPVEDIGSLYAGGLLAIQWFKFDEPSNLPEGVAFDDTDSEIGIHAIAGLRLNTPLFFEMNIGLDDAPDFKFAVGYTFESQ